jgi:hypothetical protein
VAWAQVENERALAAGHELPDRGRSGDVVVRPRASEHEIGARGGVDAEIREAL